MNNSIKKGKNTNGLALLAKLMGLAVLFNLASCGSKKNEGKLTLSLSDITDGKKELTVTVKNESQEKIKLDTIKFGIKELNRYSDKFKTEIPNTSSSTDSSTDDLFEVKGGNSSALASTQNLKELAGQEELEKGQEVNIKLNLIAGDNVKSASMKLVIQDGKVDINTKAFSWNE